jgi:hypothetical protein
MALTSNTGILTVADAASGFTWYPAAPSGGTYSWAALPNTAMSSAPPSPVPPGNTGPSSKVVAWVGHAIDTRNSTIWSAMNGGHADYGGNEVMRLITESNSPGWSQVKASTPNAQILFGQQYNSDGSPSSVHSYYGHLFNETDNRIMVIGGAFYDPNGGETFNMNSFNTVSNTYSANGTHPDIADPGSGEKYAFARDPRNDNIYAFGGFQVRRWTRSSNSWSVVLSSGGPNCYETTCAYDTARNRVFVVGSGTYTNSAHYNVDGTMVRTNVQLGGAAAGTVGGSSQGGMVYVPSLDSYLLRLSGSGGTVYRIDASTFSCTSLTTTGGTGIPATQNGPFTKFHYAPRVKCCIYVPSYTGNAWALRVDA